MIYTSSYSKYKGNRGVQISCSKPGFAKVYRSLPCLYPNWCDVKEWNKYKSLPDDDKEKIEAWERYTKSYWNKLVKTGPERVLSVLSDGDVLLCWCYKDKNCHRSILAKWLGMYGVEVKEL